MQDRCPLFGGEKKSFCSFCSIEKVGDVGFMIEACIDSLSRVDSWETTDLKTLLRRIVKIGKTGKLSEASRKNLVTQMDKKIELTRHGNDIARLVGNAYAFLGYDLKAMETLEIAINNEKDDTTALNNKGVLLARAGKERDAIECYEKVVDMDPDNENAWFNMGKAYIRTQKPRKATICFRRVVEINPRNVSAWNNLGVSLRLTGKTKEAIECYNSALRENKDYKWAWNNLGIAHMIRREYDKASESFRKALEIDPNFKEAREGLEALEEK